MLERSMNPVLFHCPKTLQQIEAGIEVNVGTLRNVQPVMLRLICPFCREPHEWKLTDGWISEPRVA
jgi:hypothetical protein